MKRSTTRRTHPSAAGVIRARGGVSMWAVLTGVVVAFGAFVVLVGLVAGVLTALGVSDPDVTRGDIVRGGLAGAIALLVVTFLAYAWGGYTAGRMARGLGLANGVLVPLIAIIVMVVLGTIVTWLGTEIDVNRDLPFAPSLMPADVGVEAEEAQRVGLGLGIMGAVVMFLGGIVGGLLGARWHTKLERRAAEDVAERDRRTDANDRPRTEPASS